MTEEEEVVNNDVNTSESDTRNNGPVRRNSPPVEYQFKPGNGGRPKGSRNKLGEHFIADLYADWQEHGAATLVEVRETKPDQYLKVVASILPKDLNVNVSRMDEMTDDELIKRLRQLDATIRPFLDPEGAGDLNRGIHTASAH